MLVAVLLGREKGVGHVRRSVCVLLLGATVLLGGVFEVGELLHPC